ncbi:MAG: hypothetical protein GOV02_01650 [Candidatus Aenigmarchaeota archaeon]|nr:hypothetical protein [Candidatus Aenigmarchaeota archaeon]
MKLVNKNIDKGIIILLSIGIFCLILSFSFDYVKTRECILDKNNYTLSSSNGEIIIGFGLEISEFEINEFVNENNFTIIESGSNKWIIINIGSGNEAEWICKLEKNSIVDFVELNYLEGGGNE